MEKATHCEDFEEIMQFLDDNCCDLDTGKKTEETLKIVLRKKQDLEHQLDVCKRCTKEGITKSQRSGDSILHKLEDLAAKQKAVLEDGESFLSTEVDPLVKSVGPLAREVEEIHKLQLYLNWIIEVNKLSQGIEKQLSENSVGMAVDLYKCMNNIYDRLKASSCKNLLTFIEQLSSLWFERLSSIILKEFNSVLIAIKWPFPNGISAPVITHNEESMELFERLTKFVLNIDPLHGNGNNSCLLLTRSLVEPLEKRFKFHFYGKRQTNNLEKPEWFFTQTLNWIRDHTQFIENTVQLLVDRELESPRDVKAEFITLLVKLVTEKMESSLPRIVDDEETFAHWIDETLLFEKEMKISYGYCDEKYRPISLLTKENYMKRWIVLEEKYFTRNIGSSLESKTAWRTKFEELGEMCDDKVPEVVEDFVSQTSVMTERFEIIPALASRLKFVDLQVSLCYQFLNHLKDTANVESAHPLQQCFCAVVNGVHYLQEVLEDWNEKPIFFRLSLAPRLFDSNAQDYPPPTDADEKEDPPRSIFGKVIDDLKMFENDLHSTIVASLKEKLVKHLRPYKNERWHCMRNLNDMVVPVLSDSGCPLVQWIRDQLIHLKSLLCSQSFNCIWPQFAREIDSQLYETVIIPNHFNLGGAGQLNHDVTKNILILFREYTLKPQSYFKRTREALNLLNLMAGSAVLLKELITSWERAKGDDRYQLEKEVERTLLDMSVENLTLEDCKQILNSRIDWPKV